MDATPDISKVISLIMENPELIEGIKSMLTKETSAVADENDEASKPKEEPAVQPVVKAQPQNDDSSGRGKRNALLKALKPYVSGERAKAIDTMMSLADVMDILKRG